jgi:hypothetical protein
VDVFSFNGLPAIAIETLSAQPNVGVKKNGSIAAYGTSVEFFHPYRLVASGRVSEFRIGLAPRSKSDQHRGQDRQSHSGNGDDPHRPTQPAIPAANESECKQKEQEHSDAYHERLNCPPTYERHGLIMASLYVISPGFSCA